MSKTQPSVPPGVEMARRLIGDNPFLRSDAQFSTWNSFAKLVIRDCAAALDNTACSQSENRHAWMLELYPKLIGICSQRRIEYFPISGTAELARFQKFLESVKHPLWRDLDSLRRARLPHPSSTVSINRPFIESRSDDSQEREARRRAAEKQVNEMESAISLAVKAWNHRADQMAKNAELSKYMASLDRDSDQNQEPTFQDGKPHKTSGEDILAMTRAHLIASGLDPDTVLASPQALLDGAKVDRFESEFTKNNSDTSNPAVLLERYVLGRFELIGRNCAGRLLDQSFECSRGKRLDVYSGFLRWGRLTSGSNLDEGLQHLPSEDRKRYIASVNSGLIGLESGLLADFKERLASPSFEGESRSIEKLPVSTPNKLPELNTAGGIVGVKASTCAKAIPVQMGKLSKGDPLRTWRRAVVKEHRTKNGLSADQFARKVSICDTAIRGVIAEDRRKFAPAVQERLLNEMGVSKDTWYAPR
jgi:hypothetical protein